MRTLLAFLAAALPAAAAAQWTLEADGALSYDDNLSNAQRSSDMARDHAAALRAALGRGFAAAGGELSLRGEARAAFHDTYSGLDRFALGLGAGWSRKLGLGRDAPRLSADAALFADDYREDVRDSRRLALSLELGRRFGPRVDASLGAAYDRREQRDELATVPGISGKPFSLQGRSLSARGGYALDENWLAFAAVSVRRGDVVSSTRRNRQIFDESAAIADDPAFGPDFIAYKLTGARTNSYTIGASRALGPRASLDAALTTHRTRAPGGLDYDGNVYSLSLVYRD